VEVPPERQALELLERAFALGIRYFDTAPSYGSASSDWLRSCVALRRQIARPAHRHQIR